MLSNSPQAGLFTEDVCVYRQGEAKHSLDEVRGRDGSQHSLDAVFLLLHVCLLMKLSEQHEIKHFNAHDAQTFSSIFTNPLIKIRCDL